MDRRYLDGTNLASQRGMRRILILSFLTFAFFGSKSAFGQESCVQCHGDILKAKTVHAAVENCDTCHESIAEPHPQAGKKTFKLPDDLAGSCAACHDPLGTKPTVHAPIKDGDCTTCHNPHASDQARLLTQSVEELCVTCHSDKMEGKHIHGPAGAGDCMSCHTPHESETKALLKMEGDLLCFSCHTDIQQGLKKKSVHSAMEGGCISCHDAHASEFPKLLAAEGEQVCFQCHSDISDGMAKAVSVHAPLKASNSCASCHSAHSSDAPKLMLSSGSQLCATCHKDIVTKEMQVVHAPIAEGDCTSCHAPHMSDQVKLLAKSFPAQKYVAYSETQYELCFSCHDRDLVRYPDTEFATDFRDGHRNLHFLHANKKDKGRSCVLCHNTHGSRNPKLIADTVPFGSWKLSLKFKKTETGGSCSPGCHQPYSYDRKVSVSAETN